MPRAPRRSAGDGEHPGGQFSDDPQPATCDPAAVLVDRLHSTGGVRGMLAVHKAGGLTIPATVLGLAERFGDIPGGLVSCTQLASIPALGCCPAGAVTAIFPADGVFVIASLAGITWPAADISAGRGSTACPCSRSMWPPTGPSRPSSGPGRAETAYPGYDPPAALARPGMRKASGETWRFKQLAERSAGAHQPGHRPAARSRRASQPGWPSANARSACCGWPAPARHAPARGRTGECRPVAGDRRDLHRRRVRRRGDVRGRSGRPVRSARGRVLRHHRRRQSR